MAVAKPRSARTMDGIARRDPGTKSASNASTPIGRRSTETTMIAGTPARPDDWATAAHPSSPLEGDRRARCSGVPAAVGAGTPGSANSPSGLLRASCCTIRGAKSAIAGIGMPRSRCTLVGRATIQTSSAITRAGTRLGADTAIAANSRAAPAEAAHDRGALSAARTSHGRSRCAITAPRCPPLSALDSGGAIAQRNAASAGSDGRVLSCRAANQAPSAASGRASR